jgi:hypothetical protein
MILKRNVLMLNKNIIYKKIIGDVKPYRGIIYLVCCIGVEYDYDIVPHTVKYYKELGVDRFLFILNTEDENSERLKYVQNILRKYNIKEEMVWIGEFNDQIKTHNMEQLVMENTNSEDWVVTIDIDEFQKYYMDLRKFISYCEKMNYTCVLGSFIDRLTENGRIVDINEDTNIWETFPTKTNMGRSWNKNTSYLKVLLRKAYVEVTGGHHYPIDLENNKCFPSRMEVHHFKWRSELIKKLKRRIEVFQKHNIPSRRIEVEEKVVKKYRRKGKFQ